MAETLKISKARKRRMTEHYMQRKYYSEYYNRRLIIMPNIKYFGWESDLLAVTKVMYLHEVEIKRSRSDFRHESKKDLKFKKINYGLGPNKFYYMVPDGLIDLNEIDERFGLIYIMKYGKIFVLREATFLHKIKLNNEQYLRILEKSYYQMWKYKKLVKL